MRFALTIISVLRFAESIYATAPKLVSKLDCYQEHYLSIDRAQLHLVAEDTNHQLRASIRKFVGGRFEFADYLLNDLSCASAAIDARVLYCRNAKGETFQSKLSVSEQRAEVIEVFVNNVKLTEFSTTMTEGGRNRCVQ